MASRCEICFVKCSPIRKLQWENISQIKFHNGVSEIDTYKKKTFVILRDFNVEANCRYPLLLCSLTPGSDNATFSHSQCLPARQEERQWKWRTGVGLAGSG